MNDTFVFKREMARWRRGVLSFVHFSRSVWPSIYIPGLALTPQGAKKGPHFYSFRVAYLSGRLPRKRPDINQPVKSTLHSLMSFRHSYLRLYFVNVCLKIHLYKTPGLSDVTAVARLHPLSRAGDVISKETSTVSQSDISMQICLLWHVTVRLNVKYLYMLLPLRLKYAFNF